MFGRIARSLIESPIRQWTRALGINRLLTIGARRKHRARLREYELTTPTQIRVGVRDVHGIMLVADAIEFMRVRSADDDRELLSALIDGLSPGDTYWDIGASIGLYSVLMAMRVGPEGRVVAFEPETRSFARLTANLAANSLQNVILKRVALGDTEGQVPFAADDIVSSGAHRIDHLKSSGATTMIDVVRGDSVRADATVRVPNALKIDVEGFEESVVRGLEETLREPACRTVLCEMHFSIHADKQDSRAPSRIRAHLKSAGFLRQEWLDASHLLARK